MTSPIKHSTIRETFAHKTVFLTGATGFVGKALVEKLLRSAPEIDHIYVLIRSRQDHIASDRLTTDIRDSPLFDRLRREQDDFDGFFSSKVSAIAGDVTSPMLGISTEDLQRVRASVQITIHSATSVKFNDPLDVAVRMNCQGALHVLAFVHSCPRPWVQCHLHLSTAYVNSNRIDSECPVVREQLYPLAFDVEEVFTAIVTPASPEELQVIHDRSIGTYPNTYTLTKSMAEHLLTKRVRPTLPPVIVRPTIIGATWQEPMPGCVDQIAGAGALWLAVGMGVHSLQLGNDTYTSDAVPLDLVVNTTLVSIAYALSRTKAHSPQPTPVRPFIVHSGTSDLRENPTNLAVPNRAMLAYFQAHPPITAFFKPQFRMIRSHKTFRIACFFRYKLRLSTLSTVATLSSSRRLRKKADGLKKLTSKARAIIAAFEPFFARQWIFEADAVEQLRAFGGLEQSDGTWWLEASDIDWRQWTTQYCMGLKKYVLQEDGIEMEMQGPKERVRPIMAAWA